ncbi:YbjN domain-containing protein [Serinibacter salmoneus]|uniref:TY-Chap central domain-containing protein n=1 Tax=Serinibacter salmoneus TaxID=556530 RepID=A0A2A9CVV0_9MICO|nr:YbjN domain-containing protein [Serinibacter salmoneus]PFG18544.1 hypothetical protein ATL40_0082 [Serinibacter salmoneus]
MGDRAAVQAKVQEFLAASFRGVTLERNGYSIGHGSARCFVKVRESTEDGPIIINITAPLLFDVPATPALYEYIALHADDYVFGHLSALRAEDADKVHIYFTHQLLGDYLDHDELDYAVGAVMTTADDLDDTLQVQFGGARFHES